MHTVLVIEDEEVLRLTFSEFLAGEGYDVVVADNYDEAVASFAQHDFDAIVTDILLAGKTGVDLLRKVRDLDLKAPVIMITGEPNVETASQAVRLGAF